MFTRYLLRRFFRLFFLVLFSTLFVYVLLDFVGNIRVWLLREPKDVAEYYLNFIPNIVYLVMPVNLLLAVVGVVGSMARHLEITSMKTAGRSVLRITAPLLVVSVLIAGAMFWANEEILPDANHRRLELAQPPTDQSSKIRREKQKNRAVVVGDGVGEALRKGPDMRCVPPPGQFVLVAAAIPAGGVFEEGFREGGVLHLLDCVEALERLPERVVGVEREEVGEEVGEVGQFVRPGDEGGAISAACTPGSEVPAEFHRAETDEAVEDHARDVDGVALDEGILPRNFREQGEDVLRLRK